MNIEQIRQSITAAKQGKLDEIHIYFLVDEISKYEETHTLPIDVRQWYDEMNSLILQYEEGLGGDWEG